MAPVDSFILFSLLMQLLGESWLCCRLAAFIPRLHCAPESRALAKATAVRLLHYPPHLPLIQISFASLPNHQHIFFFQGNRTQFLVPTLLVRLLRISRLGEVISCSSPPLSPDLIVADISRVYHPHNLIKDLQLTSIINHGRPASSWSPTTSSPTRTPGTGR